jgi:hypothetical protein
LLCKNRKIRLIGWVIIRWTFVDAMAAGFKTNFPGVT